MVSLKVDFCCKYKATQLCYYFPAFLFNYVAQPWMKAVYVEEKGTLAIHACIPGFRPMSDGDSFLLEHRQSSQKW